MTKEKKRFVTRKDKRTGKFFVFDLNNKLQDIYMSTRKAARAMADEMNANEQHPPQAA